MRSSMPTASPLGPLGLVVLLTLVIWPASASTSHKVARESAAAASLSVTFRPKTDSARKVVGIEVEQHMHRDGQPRPLALIAPMRFNGMVSVAAAVIDLTVIDRQGAVAVQAADWTMLNETPGRRWTTTRFVSGPVTVRYRMPMTPVGQGGPPYGIKAAGYGLGGNTGRVLMLPELADLRSATLGWDLSEMVQGSRGVMAGGSGTITIPGPPDAMLDRWLLAGSLTAGQTSYGRGFNAYSVGSAPFDARTMMAWARRTYRVLSRSFGYLGEPPYLLLIRTLDAPSFATGTASVAHSASLMTVGSPTFLPGQNEAGFRGGIAHEKTHNWVGFFGKNAAPWFAEGPTV